MPPFDQRRCRRLASVIGRMNMVLSPITAKISASFRMLIFIVASAALAGCATLPASGPTGSEIRSQIAADAGRLGITLVQVQTINDLASPPTPLMPHLPEYASPPETELVGPGDVLNVSIFETGIALFGGSGRIGGQGASGFDPASRSEKFPPLRVSDQGSITIPYVGQLRVAGRTTRDIEMMLRQALRSKSQNPQALVSIAEGLTNSVIISGDIARPGRVVLPTNREKLSEVIALAGGNKGEVHDIVVKVARNGAFQEWRLSDVFDNPDLDMRIYPSDRISLLRKPRSFTVLGAPGQTSKFPFQGAKASLIEALALAGGPNPSFGNARAIFVFRIERDERGKETPVVYHFNMMQASSYILAQKFEMEDKDVIYIGNAAANQPSKLVQVLSQLFFPLVALQQAGAL
jgi:polysaccharide export outer membrane protein